MPTWNNQRSYTYVPSPPDLSNKLKAAAALEGTNLQQYLVRLLQAHIADLERRGVLPKPKGK